MKIYKGFLYLIIFIFSSYFSAQKTYSSEDYIKLRKNYEDLPENDEQALPYIKIYLREATKEKNYSKIFQGYQDAVFYTKDKEKKLSYADVCLKQMLKSNDDELISSAYLEKGVVYYFFFKHYQPALNNYLKAYESSKHISNGFLRYRIVYQLGVVKSYLGYYADASELFKECINYFQPLTSGNLHPNLIYNNKKGYFNSVHQQIICYEKLKNFKLSDSLLAVGMSTLPSSERFDLEKAYFIKEKAISDFRKSRYKDAVSNLSMTLPIFKKYNDVTWFAVSSFYLGKSFGALKNDEKAISYFRKVDSVFQKQNFIIPELRSNYEILINYYNSKGNKDAELFYTKQLIKVDNILGNDFQYLSPKIHKEYDTKALLEKQRILETNYNFSFLFVLVLLLSVAILLVVIYIKRKKEKHILSQYKALENRILNHENNLVISKVSFENQSSKDNKNNIPENVVNDILKKLNEFERKKGFVKKGLTQQELAKSWGTNTTYLSQVVNEFKGKNFNSYLNEMRIKYITTELYHNSRLLDYTIEGLSEKCGMSSRQNFSDIFTEINGVRPAYFLKKRKQELQDDTTE
ncbi:helix-turn-helix domain-containing protein [Chryseobacterium luquanense]|uniref:Helix-turn-helix domain-containing protein n=1 Tax=Chryseobacterium luquanense TaxID=2983766 RepID=A0ABT3Y8Y6_9FLAO|nr:helix-turn-helix domain-containing protein [Chryseobacterium luquanense]MCX8534640.1 helix-turn-helix domain-containing protein [Chryseobacterium luquanense]